MTRTFGSAISLALFLSACTATPETPPAGESGESLQDVSLRPATAQEVKGSWDVVRFNDFTPAIRLEGDKSANYFRFFEGGIGGNVGCNGAGMNGTLVDGRFIPAADQNLISTQMACSDDLEAREQALREFIASGPTFEIGDDGRLVGTSQNGSELILERPDVRRLAYAPDASDIEGEWYLRAVSDFPDTGGHSSRSLDHMAGMMSLSDGMIRHSLCPGLSIAYSYEVNRGRLKTSPVSAEELAKCDVSGERSPNASPSFKDAISLMGTSPNAEWNANRYLVLWNDDNAITLAKDKSPTPPPKR